MAYHLSISRRSRYTQDLVLFCMTLSVGAEYHEGLIIFWKVRKSTNMGKFKNPLRNRNVIFVIVITTFTGLQLTVGLAWNNITHHRYVIYKEPQNYWEIKSHTALWTMYMWIFGLVVIIQSFFGVKLSQRQVNLSAETLELNQKHRKNCECCHHHSLFKGHNVNVNTVVLNCQKCNQCHKCQVSGFEDVF